NWTRLPRISARRTIVTTALPFRCHEVEFHCHDFAPEYPNEFHLQAQFKIFVSNFSRTRRFGNTRFRSGPNRRNIDLCEAFPPWGLSQHLAKPSVIAWLPSRRTPPHSFAPLAPRPRTKA